MSTLSKSQILVAIALPIESDGLVESSGVPLLYTGAGKIHASVMLTQALASSSFLPSLVINYGTAGSKRISPDTFVACREFVQRDMLASSLGVEPFVTPYSKHTTSPLTSMATAKIGERDGYKICGSGDSFVENWDDSWPFDLVDMEAYALAHVCEHFDIPFISYKYIADSCSVEEWLESCHKGSKIFKKDVLDGFE